MLRTSWLFLCLSVLPLVATGQSTTQPASDAVAASGVVSSVSDHGVQVWTGRQLVPSSFVMAAVPMPHSEADRAAMQVALQKEALKRAFASAMLDVEVDENTEILQDGKTWHDLSVLHAGDQIGVHARISPDAKKLVATKLTTDRTSISGVIQEAASDAIVVETGSGLKHVHLSPQTIYAFTRALAEGQDIRIDGWDFGNEIDAARIAVYNTDVPMRFEGLK
jgi:hypothetical protein